MRAIGDGETQTGGIEFVGPQKIACGNAHTLYLEGPCAQDTKADRDATSLHVYSKVIGWGSNRHNQLGMHISAEERTHLSQSGWRKPWDEIAGKPSEKVFFDNDPDGTLGNKNKIDDKTLRQVFEISCGGNFSMVLERVKGDDSVLMDSKLWSFGLNTSGQLGRGFSLSEEDFGDMPHDDEHGPAGLVKISIPGSLDNHAVVQRVCCGTDHTLAIVNFVGPSGSYASVEGRLFAWGVNNYGALGTKSNGDESIPTEVWFPEDIYSDVGEECWRRVRVRQVAAGFKHSLALVNCDAEKGSTEGDSAVQKDEKRGVVYTWGFGGNGRLGLGAHKLGDVQSSSAEFEPKEVTIGSGSQIKYIAAGESHSGAVDQLGGLYTWGQGSHGRCGHGLAIDYRQPSRVESLLGVAIDKIAFGLMHSVAASVKGELYAWGKGPATGLDAGDNASVMTPRRVELPEQGAETVFQIAAGPLHTLVLLTDGHIYCFGSGSENRMIKAKGGAVEGVRRDQAYPKKIEPPNNKGWSKNESDSILGAGRKQTRTQEQAKGWWPKRISCNGSQSALVTNDGEVYVWGAGSIAGGSENQPATPDQNDEYPDVPEPSKIKRFSGSQRVRLLAVGLDHCLAVTEEANIMYSWGKGHKGQLGTGSLKTTVHPQSIPHPTDVIGVAAGEEHSACIIGGGEAYTWGNAEGGRLGQGGCLSEGNQLQPKQVPITCSEADVLLESVSCGAQHTAIVSNQKDLLTFGTGWFGRLGQGNLENKYSAAFTKNMCPSRVQGDVKVKDVYCGMYHTCIVDSDSLLWVCGRDTSICCDSPDGDKHVLEPIPFQPFWEPQREIVSLATCEQHTLAVTRIKHGGASNPTELWVWGKNSRGQLGLPETVAPRISSPWQLRIGEPDKPGKKPSHEVAVVSTGPYHSMCLLKPKHRKGQGGNYPIVYSWGLSTRHRLGLDLKPEARKLRRAFLDSAVKSKIDQSNVEPPDQVTPEWRPIWDDDDDLAMLEVEIDEASLAQPSSDWLSVQQKMYTEAPDKKVAKLEETRAKTEKLYKAFMQDILKLWKKPESSGDVTEYSIRQKERAVEVEYVRTLKALGLGGSTSAPKLEGRITTDPEILLTLHNYEELLWVLQQQPCYLANVAQRLLGRKEDDEDAKLFHRVCHRLYEQMHVSRTRNLFKALMKLIIEREMAKATKIDELFDPTKSRTSSLIAQLCTNPYFVKDLAMPVVNPSDENSLVSAIIKYTLSRDGKNLRGRESRDGKAQTDFISGIFTVEKSEYEEYDAEDRKRRGKDQLSKENEKKRQSTFGYELKEFNSFIIEPDEANVDHDHQKQRTDLSSIADFIGRFINHILTKHGCKDIQHLLVTAFDNLITLPRLVIQCRDGDGFFPSVCSPISALVLSSILGGILEELVRPGPLALLRAKLRDQVEIEKEKIRKKGGKQGKHPDEDSGTEHVETLVRRVEYNIVALAKLFKRVVHPHVWYLQYPGRDKKFEKDHEDTARQLRDFVNNELFHALREKPGTDREKRRLYKEDTTETDMTVDLYTTHYSLDQHRVCLSTSDLLDLANMLHLFTTADKHDQDSSVVQLDAVDKDRVALLVKKILPKDKGETIEWNKDGYVWIASQVGESHNFTMRARFLEFHNTGKDEPTFCQISGAPIPRSIATKEQKENSGLRCLKPFREPPEKGPPIDLNGVEIYPFQKLEQLLQDLSGSQAGENASKDVKFKIKGQSFMDLRTEFENFQKKISTDIQEGRSSGSGSNDLLKKLEDAKTMVDKIRETSDEKLFRTFLDKEVKRRSDYKSYLELVTEGSGLIDDAKGSYKNALKQRERELKQIISFTENCDIPDEIASFAQLHSQTLAFSKGKRIKNYVRQNEATPAQKILESLVRASTEGKVTEEIKDMVGVPARHFTLKEMSKKGVIVRMNEKIPVKLHKDIVIIFQAENEGFTVQAKMENTMLQEFVISREDIMLMESGRKNAILAYGEKDFLWVNCFRLRRLLAWIAAEGGL